jgi:hypothetical protein
MRAIGVEYDRPARGFAKEDDLVAAESLGGDISGS